LDIANYFRARASAFEQMAAAQSEALAAFVESVLAVVRAGGTLLIAGNGGSAAECQHFAAELVVRYRINRRPLPAIALTTDTSALTACGNDFAFAEVFARQVEALGRPGDALIVLSTSGQSENLIHAATVAARRGVSVVGLLGKGGGTLAQLCQSAFVVPSDDTAIIQEVHLAIIHAICEGIDAWVATSSSAS
jgi:D-sedoheptulose 7-phosphate isomerase